MYDPNLDSPFLQRFLNDLPDYLRNEKIHIIEVRDLNLSPSISLQIGHTNFFIIHELKSGKTRVLEGEHEVLSENHNPELFKDFIAEVLKKG